MAWVISDAGIELGRFQLNRTGGWVSPYTGDGGCRIMAHSHRWKTLVTGNSEVEALI